jgi:hypothetical protein
MPHYFFHLLDEANNNLVTDSVGCSLSDAGQAKKEAVGNASASRNGVASYRH